MINGAVVSRGGLLPREILDRLNARDSDLPGTAPTDYGLVASERIADAVNRSWNRLVPLWAELARSLQATLPANDHHATTLTRNRWLRPLLEELGFARSEMATGELTVDDRSYPVSHCWGGRVPVHQLGAEVPLDRRTPGVPGAAAKSPHGLVQELLNRSPAHLWGIVTNGRMLRVLRDNVSLTRQAYLEFDLERIFSDNSYSDFTALWLCCHSTRFAGDPPSSCLLEQWNTEAARAGTRALDRLRDGVERAITELGRGFLAHRENADLRRRLRDGELAADDYLRALLRTVYRLLFLLVTESRDLLLDPKAGEAAQDRYRRFYSVERLRTLASKQRGSPHCDLWEQHRVVARALGHEAGAPAIGIAPLGGDLWSPGFVAALGHSVIDNRHLLAAVRALCLVRDREARVTRPVDYRNLGVEELGSIYESLLELHAEIGPGPQPSFNLAAAAGSERKTTGSYYTPSSLIDRLLDSALDPVIEEAEAADNPKAALLALRVLDPACGSGHFLIAAAHRIANRLAAIRSEGGEPDPDTLRHALREVIGHCVYGIDKNPMAVELCKVSLWLEAMEPGRPLNFLDHHMACGNSLLGTTPKLLAEGVPNEAFKALTGDDKEWVKTLRKANRLERKQRDQGMLAWDSPQASDSAELRDGFADIDGYPDDSLFGQAAKQQRYQELRESDAAQRSKLAADAWCAAFVAPKKADSPAITDRTVRILSGEPDPASAAAAEAHLADCLFCRIRLNRIKIDDPRLEPPAFAVPAPPLSEEALKLLAAHPPACIGPDQVWYARGEHEQLMVWVSHEPIGFDAAVIAHAVTANIDAVDDSALIVDLPKIGPVAVFSSIIGLVPKSKFVAHLGDLDIASDLRRLFNGDRSGLETGLPVTDPNDERHEFDQFLIDQLADLNPITEPPDEEDDSTVLTGALGAPQPETV